jgi:hypothetical protein
MRFANTLRARPGALVLSDAPDAWTVRVQAAEAWDAVRVVCAPSTTVTQLKQAAMAALLPDVTTLDDYCVKLHGALVEREAVTLAAAGAKDASTFFVTSRRRQPIL